MFVPDTTPFSQDTLPVCCPQDLADATREAGAVLAFDGLVLGWVKGGREGDRESERARERERRPSTNSGCGGGGGRAVCQRWGGRANTHTLDQASLGPCHTLFAGLAYLTQSVFKVVLQKSTPTKIRQSILEISNNIG